MSHGNIINAHSAVLPYARGMYALEQIVAENNYNKFKCAVGSTIHYIDHGIDTGTIIKATNLLNPLQYESIWAVKAECYLLSYNMLHEHIQNLLMSSSSYTNLYYAKHYNEEIKISAEQNYLTFKQLQLNTPHQL
ncbi:MAG: formyltransferase family protein [Burkholderiales bacterium]|nr:formyltransferase family protein [Burkholderiales bacterium]